MASRPFISDALHTIGLLTGIGADRLFHSSAREQRISRKVAHNRQRRNRRRRAEKHNVGNQFAFGVNWS